MNGQGRPRSSVRTQFSSRFAEPFKLRHLPLRVVLLAGFVATLIFATTAKAAETSLRLRFVWGGAEEELWRGSISIPNGKFKNVQLLGTEGDQPGAYVIQGDRILISPRYESSYTGLEATVTADRDAVLEVGLDSQSQVNNRQPKRVSLKRLIEDEFVTSLQDGHQLQISRCVGDKIRVRFPKEAMVFSPGEPTQIDVLAHELDTKPVLRARFRLRPVRPIRHDVTEFWNQRDDSLWTETRSIRLDDQGLPLPLTNLAIPIPKKEGAYNLVIDLLPRLPQVGAVARKTIQFVVVDFRQPPPIGSDGRLVTEFDPAADPNWFERLTQLPQWRLLPGTARGPWSNKEPLVQRHGEKSWTKLQPDSWVAYSLPVDKADIPHILEVEIPTDLEQSLGVSILDSPTKTNRHPHIESTVSMGDPDLVVPRREEGTTTHRVVFWPSNSSPAVVIANRNENRTAVFGKIRLFEFPDGLPQPETIRGERKRIAVLDAELLQKIFFKQPTGNDESITVDTWHGFLVASQRLVSYLRFAGYDGAAINVASRGSSIFPSDLLLATPRFDQGIYSSQHQDPFRKDILELLLRIFDREGMVLIPTIELATPLVELETILAQGQKAAEGIELVDIDGQLGAEVFEATTRRAPYYNLLDTRVQTAIGRIINELVQRYSKHSSFQGINLTFGKYTYTQLRGANWGFDERTLDSFARSVLGAGQTWDTERLQEMLRNDVRRGIPSNVVRDWLQWRSHQIKNFYAQLASLLGSHGDTLFLSLTDLMDTRQWQQKLRPGLPREPAFYDVMKELGLDIPALRQTDHLILLRPNRIDSLDHLGSQAVNLELAEPDIQQAFSPATIPAANYEYESRIATLTDFNTKGPARQTAHQFLTSSVLAGAHARKHLALNMAEHDDQWIFEGGRSIQFGQEHELDSFFEVYRSLPKRAFKKVEFEQSNPLVTRLSYTNRELVAYFVNPSPWVANSTIQWEAPPTTHVSLISSMRKQVEDQDLANQSFLRVQVEPFGIFALRFNDPRTKLVRCESTLPPSVGRELKVQLDELVSRKIQIERVGQSKPWQPGITELAEQSKLLRDPGFELLGDENERHWFRDGTGTLKRDHQIKAEGNASLYMSCDANESVAVISHEFPAPETGRLIVKVKRRTSKNRPPPQLSLRLESSVDDYEPHHLFENVSLENFADDEPLSFLDLPTDPNLKLRIRIELVGAVDPLRRPSEVWVDDIQLYDRYLFKDEIKDEKKVLTNIIQRAGHHERKGNWAACYQILSGYWPRFLLRHVPPPQVAARPAAQPSREKKVEPKPKKNRFFDLRRFVPQFR